MYRVLLVDDEPTIREGLSTLIPWQELGYEVIDMAANGQEALQKCNQLRPDLLIVDIRMPGMTGLELIRQIRGLELDMRVLILSGYADFEYAKQAISYRIDGYLLKPVDEDELIGYLDQLRSEMDSARFDKVNRQDEPELRLDSLLAAFLSGEQLPSAAYAQLERKLQWDSFEVMLIKPVTSNEMVPALHTLIKHKLTELFDNRDRGAAFSMPPYVGVLLKGALGDEKQRRSLYKEIWDSCEQPVIDIFAVSGGEAGRLEEIAVSYEIALDRIQNRFFLEKGTISRADRETATHVREDDADSLDELFADAAGTLYLALEVGNSDSVRRFIQHAAEEMVRKGSTEEEIKTRFVQLFSTVLDKLTRDRSEMHSIELRASMVEIYKETRYLALIDRLSAIAEGMAGTVDNGGSDTLIKRVLDFIHRNYAENLKLEKLAELFNYNSAYLGKLFKQVTGEHFNTYLDKVRMEQAKLLIEQGLKVYQVAEKVGYANVDYFHIKFRKYVGTSPTGYKKS
ncbi:DNA-binding response regulator [Cohnella endophytica]|uniref:DNA-binding response regulator n=1 Tax=Cohnella endophytica TaxID=2419778 RepID=A0A494Y2J9_9BACL|nr:response regulator transcription factor [Cohnella endophytica]RKP56976.1 DNA-binding response regulator [Cohnella endophytica]